MAELLQVFSNQPTDPRSEPLLADQEQYDPSILNEGSILGALDLNAQLLSVDVSSSSEDETHDKSPKKEEKKKHRRGGSSKFGSKGARTSIRKLLGIKDKNAYANVGDGEGVKNAPSDETPEDSRALESVPFYDSDLLLDSPRAVAEIDATTHEQELSTNAAEPPLSPLEASTNPYEQGFRLRSCELEPSEHQLKLPNCNDVLMHARLCHLLENYQQIVENSGSDFDFGSLVGLSRMELEAMHTHLTMPSSGSMMTPQFQPHPSVLKSLLESSVDMTVEGFFTDSSGVQAAVFATQHHRQFVVCYRGSPERQRKPLKKDETEHPALYPSDHSVPIGPSFREAYFEENLENQVFDLLNRLSNDSPFCDVVYTGHSFGGALATIGAVRFAENFPIMTVSCHVFGSPRVGQKEFRELAHSLPNLNIIRVDNGTDPYVFFPEGKKWTHVGHTVRIGMSDDEKARASAKAFKFDDKETREADAEDHAIRMQLFKAKMVGMGKTKMKKDHEMSHYIDSMEKFTHSGSPWAMQFEGVVGDGIKIKKNDSVDAVSNNNGEETRFVV